MLHFFPIIKKRFYLTNNKKEILHLKRSDPAIPDRIRYLWKFKKQKKLKFYFLA